AWFHQGLERLLDTLRTASADLQCFTFVSGVAPREFWIRRQAHETAIHRADIEAATGVSITEVECWFAQDGLSEVVGAFAREPQFALQGPGRLLLVASDGPSWKIDFDGNGNQVSVGQFAAADADAVLYGTSDRLYRWAWNRPVDHLTATGDLTLLRAWRQTVRLL
ncbi:MAG TPA: maleylpyruvate isomerase family mycothiol-dependent enzyme, partial [Candidatus Limnocylindrales bacterium]